MKAVVVRIPGGTSRGPQGNSQLSREASTRAESGEVCVIRMLGMVNSTEVGQYCRAELNGVKT